MQLPLVNKNVAIFAKCVMYDTSKLAAAADFGGTRGLCWLKHSALANGKCIDFIFPCYTDWYSSNVVC